MQRTLNIGPELGMPLSWIQLATVVYGARGSGKTVLGSVMAEEATKCGQRFCAIDLKGDWYGLKSSADGKREGLPVVIFGGDHADLPLEDGAGKWMGETVAKLAQSCVLDLENLSKTKQRRLLADFFESLYEHNREPLLLLMDESQRYAPQAGGRGIDPEIARCLGAVEDLIKLGRKHGIGPVLISQRGSSLNKECSELCDVLVAFRTPGPLDQDRIKDWLDANTTRAQRDEVMSQLSGLETGTAVFASGHPRLKLFGVFDVRMRETFDSSATPEIGKRRREPTKLAEPDLAELRLKMGEAIQRQKDEDPRELRKKIAELERELKTKTAPTPTKIERVEVPIIGKEGLAALHNVTKELTELSLATHALQERVDAASVAWRKATENAYSTELLREARAARQTPTGTLKLYKSIDQSKRVTNGDRKLSKCARMILTAIAQRYPRATTKSQAAIMSGYSVKSSSFDNAMSELRIAELIEGSGAALTLTAAPRELGIDFDVLPTEGPGLLRYWVDRLGKCESALLAALADAYPRGLDKKELADRSGYSEASSGFDNALSRLRTLKLAEGERGAPIRASEELFP